MGIIKRVGTFVGSHMPFVIPSCIIVGCLAPDVFATIKSYITKLGLNSLWFNDIICWYRFIIDWRYRNWSTYSGKIKIRLYLFIMWSIWFPR